MTGMASNLYLNCSILWRRVSVAERCQLKEYSVGLELFLSITIESLILQQPEKAHGP
jgi:hypothetical protein